jgi:hypothetical protein
MVQQKRHRFIRWHAAAVPTVTAQWNAQERGVHPNLMHHS